MPIFRITAATLVLAVGWARAQSDELADAIRKEALLPSLSAEGRPLPLAGHWHCGVTVKGYGPAYQKRQLDAGHYLLPWFAMPMAGDNKIRSEYYEEPIRRCARLRLPIVFVGTQWERLLSVERAYFDLPADKNPNLIKTDGTKERKLSPFGAVEPWRDVGRQWGSHPMLAKIQQWYPDPPLVLFLSNNEHPKLRWHEVDQCRKFVSRFGTGLSDDEKRRRVAEGWKERYGTLFAGLRDGLGSTAWKEASIFAGYNAFVPSFVGRWPGWPQHSLHYGKSLSAWSEIWNGASVPYYTNPWDGSTDCNLWSPQVEAMNWVAGLDRLPTDNFWFELSTWDGNVPGKPNDKREQYARAGQTYGPERYGGYVQYGMWLTRPRVVREFRAHNETLEPTEPYFLQVMACVDRVHKSPELAEFWRHGRLVANPARKHPYNTILPEPLVGANRWYRLDTSLDPPGKWRFHTELPVFALALELGERPKRRWLLHAHAPLGDRSAVTITVPEGRDVTVDIPLGGRFWIIDEAGGEPKAIAAE